jgi:Ca2+-binding EF-hand superfamily protein
LEKDEWSQMRERYSAADLNKDSVITVNELAQHLSNDNRGAGQATASSGRNGGRERGNANPPTGRGAGSDARRSEAASAKKSYRFLSPAERLQETLPSRHRDWFLEKDQNGDGQVAMSEFTDAWSQLKVDEFTSLDLDADGVITPKEYVRSKSE